MRGPKNRKKVKRLFILGAGASHSASQPPRSASKTQAPLDKDFTKKIATTSYQIPHWVNDAVTAILQTWKDKSRAFQSYGLEEAIIRQMGNIEFIDSIHPRARQGIVEVSAWVDVLSHLIAFILFKSKECKSQPYKKFASEVFPKSLDAINQDNRIITFNYDDLLDRHLLKRFGISKLYFDKLQNSPTVRQRGSAKFEHPLLIKLHGSITWRCTYDEFSRLIDNEGSSENPYWIDTVWHDSSKTPSPTDDISPLLLPPMRTKPITHFSLFRFLWTKAYEYLHEAEEIIICGYSLPPADLLAESLFGNFTNQGIKEVTVVDPDPTILTKWQSLFKRNKVSKNIRWHYHSDFVEYVNEM